MNYTDMAIANMMTIYSLQDAELEQDETNLMELLSHRNNY